MLHAKFQDHRTVSSVEEDLKGFGLIWVWWPSWSQNLCPSSQGAHIKFGFDGQVVSQKKIK